MITGLFGLLPASYKGVSFLVTKESIDDCGRKRVIHSYPKTGVQFAEDMGNSPDEFTVDIIFQGSTYQDDFEAFKEAMQDSDPGQLVLPTFGVYNNMIALPATGTHDHTSLTNITITIKFVTTVQQPSSTTPPPAQEDAFLTAITAVQNISNALANILKVPATLNNLNTLKNDIGQIINQIGQTAGATPAITVLAITQLTNAISNPASLAGILFGTSGGFLQGIYQSYGASTPPVPSNSVTNVYSPSLTQPAFNGYQGLCLVGYNLSTSLWEIFNGIVLPFITPSSIIPIWPSVTTEQQARNTNRLCFVNAIRLWALIMMMLQAIVQTYLTVSQLTNVMNIIDGLFNSLIENDNTGVLIPLLKTDMEAMKNVTFAILQGEESSNNEFQTATINLEKIVPAAILSYELYGEYINQESDLLYYKNILLGLNPSQAAHAFQPGPVTVVVV